MTTLCGGYRISIILWRLAGYLTPISKGKTYGDPNKKMIWDFADDSVMQFYGPISTYPMFYVKLNGSLSKADFESFACHFWDDSVTPHFQLGSCSITFKMSMHPMCPQVRWAVSLHLDHFLPGTGLEGEAEGLIFSENVLK